MKDVDFTMEAARTALSTLQAIEKTASPLTVQGKAQAYWVSPMFQTEVEFSFEPALRFPRSVK